MTAEIVNLKQFRKQQARSDKDKLAEQNRITFGRTRSEKDLTKKLNDISEKTLNQGHLEPPKADE